MDDLVSKGKGDEEYKEMFHDMYVLPTVVFTMLFPVVGLNIAL